MSYQYESNSNSVIYTGDSPYNNSPTNKKSQDGSKFRKGSRNKKDKGLDDE